MITKERLIEYKMPKEYVETILKKYKKNPRAINSKEGQNCLCFYVNNELVLRGTCIKVIPY